MPFHDPGSNDYLSVFNLPFAATDGFTFTSWVRFDQFSESMHLLSLQSGSPVDTAAVRWHHGQPGDGNGRQSAVVSYQSDPAEKPTSTAEKWFTSSDADKLFFCDVGEWCHYALTHDARHDSAEDFSRLNALHSHGLDFHSRVLLCRSMTGRELGAGRGVWQCSMFGQRLERPRLVRVLDRHRSKWSVRHPSKIRD